MIYLKEAKHSAIFCVNCINHKPSILSWNERSRRRWVCTQQMCRVLSAQSQTPISPPFWNVTKRGSNISCNLYDGLLMMWESSWRPPGQPTPHQALTMRRSKQQRANKRHGVFKENTRCEFFYEKLKYILGTMQVNKVVCVHTVQLFVFYINTPQSFWVTEIQHIKNMKNNTKKTDHLLPCFKPGRQICTIYLIEIYIFYGGAWKICFFIKISRKNRYNHLSCYQSNALSLLEPIFRRK